MSQTQAERDREAWYGRALSLDPRDQNHLMKPPMAKAAEITARYWTPGHVLDQGPSPHCVGYSGYQFLATGPVRNRRMQDAPWLYEEAQKVDEWPGEDYPGTSVRALFAVLKREGYVTGYEWAFKLEPAVAHVLTKGPVVLGTNWYEGMDDADADGFLHPTGELYGGHAYLVIGANRKRRCPDKSLGAFRIVNSWGADWGQRGRAWISFTDAARLIADEWGEACTATEIKRKP